MVSTKSSVGDFWRWFSCHSTDLAAKKVSRSIVAQLEEHLFRIHRLDWEIGPGLVAPSLFALSPSGDRATLHLTRAIIAEAPQLDGWEFHAAKPRRRWELVFSLDLDGRPVEVDAKQWEFVAYRFKDQTYDLLLKPDDASLVLEDALQLAATIILDGELGELTRLELIGEVEIVSSWDERSKSSARRIEPGLLAKVVTRT